VKKKITEVRIYIIMTLMDIILLDKIYAKGVQEINIGALDNTS